LRFSCFKILIAKIALRYKVIIKLLRYAFSRKNKVPTSVIRL